MTIRFIIGTNIDGLDIEIISYHTGVHVSYTISFYSCIGRTVNATGEEIKINKKSQQGRYGVNRVIKIVEQRYLTYTRRRVLS